MEDPKLKSLAWIADVPLFVDQPKIAALYDAVLRPESKEGKTVITAKSSKETSGKVTGEAGVELETSSWLQLVFPFLKGKATVKAGGELGHSSGAEEGREVEFHPIETPLRQLLVLALHYHYNLPERLHFATGDLASDTTWLLDDYIQKMPRALVFIDFPPCTAFIPTALELASGGVQTVYPELMKLFAGPKTIAPTYPEPAYYRDDQMRLASDREAYWSFFKNNFSSTISMEAVENASRKGDRIRWIHYRVPVTQDRYLHLDLDAYSGYDAGTFAYRLIKRGYKHGLRMIGTLKSEPDMNVLAIFEK